MIFGCTHLAAQPCIPVYNACLDYLPLACGDIGWGVCLPGLRGRVNGLVPRPSSTVCQCCRWFAKIADHRLYRNDYISVLPGLRGEVRAEWDETKQQDVLFLLNIRTDVD